MPQLATIAAFGFPDFNPPTLLKVYKGLGCNTAQYYRNPANPPRPADAKRIAEDCGLPFDSLHGLFGPDLDPSSPDKKIRDFAVATYRAEGDLVREVGGTMVVVHPAPISGDVAKPPPKSPSDQKARAECLTQSMIELARYGEETGVVYLFENLPHNYKFGDDPPALAAIIRKLDHPHVRMCFDTGHAHMTGKAADFLPQCADVVDYLHVHDNNSTIDNHQIPGVGTLPWDQFATSMQTVSPTVIAMLELFDKEEVMVAAAKNGLGPKLRKWLAIG